MADEYEWGEWPHMRQAWQYFARMARCDENNETAAEIFRAGFAFGATYMIDLAEAKDEVTAKEIYGETQRFLKGRMVRLADAPPTREPRPPCDHAKPKR